MNERDDDMRDAHLREALRHAPDAQLEAPAALGEFILKAARAKARVPSPAASTPAPRWARGLWDWLARPAVATAFAGVMAATLVGLMWWDRPMDDAMPRSQVPTASPAPQASGRHSTPASPAAPSTPPARAATRTGAPDATRPASKSDDVARAKTYKVEEGASRQRKESTTDDTPVPPAAIDERRLESAHVSAAPPPAAPAVRVATPSLAQLRALLEAEPARWTWQRDSADPQALTGAVHAWLARLDADSNDRWQAAQGSAPDGRMVLRLYRDGHMAHELRVVDGGVVWQGNEGDRRFVSLPPSSLRALDNMGP